MGFITSEIPPTPNGAIHGIAAFRDPRRPIAYDRTVSSFAERVGIIQERIEGACRRAGRPPEEVRLMAVSKVHPAKAIAEAAAAGLTLFGENRVQEFEAKREQLQGLGVTGAEVHLIGHLQSNKASRAAEIFDAVDSVDSARLAERLNEAAGRRGKPLPVLLEIKLSEEPTKNGLDPEGAETRLVLERMPDWKNLTMRGLMTIAPLDEAPERARRCFRQLRGLRERWSAEFPHLDFHELSMGMSGDFEIAVEEGSTMVRIGTALFGARPRPR